VKLQQYRKENKLTLAAFAELLNAKTSGETIYPSAIQRWETGTIPRQENMRRVMEATGHQVTFADFYDEPKRRAAG